MPLILLNKPCGVLSQFSDAEGKRSLRGFLSQPGVYPAGRLDADSEGLLLLTDDGVLQARITQPRSKLAKAYWAQVDGSVEQSQLERLQSGIELKDGFAAALQARIIDEPARLWPRDPPIRYRRNKPTAWIDLVIDEGRNRQVRRMTAAVGLPTLRLVRHAVGPWSLGDLAPGQHRSLSTSEAWQALDRFGTAEENP